MANPGTAAVCAQRSSALQLIDTAERLIGERGLGRVSFRQISQAAGQGNNYAVQYHFGDLAGLIRAILRSRMTEVELVRSHMLADLSERGELGNARALTDVLYLPLIERRDASGNRYYARFILALQSSPDGLPFAAEHFGLMHIAVQILDLLHNSNPQLPLALIHERQRLISFMVLTSVFNRLGPCQGAGWDKGLIDNVLDMATAALLAPIAESTAAMFCEAGMPSALHHGGEVSSGIRAARNIQANIE